MPLVRTMSGLEVRNSLMKDQGQTPSLFSDKPNQPVAAAGKTAEHLPAGFGDAVGGANADLRKWMAKKNSAVGFPQMMARS